MKTTRKWLRNLIKEIVVKEEKDWDEELSDWPRTEKEDIEELKMEREQIGWDFIMASLIVLTKLETTIPMKN